MSSDPYIYIVLRDGHPDDGGGTEIEMAFTRKYELAAFLDKLKPEAWERPRVYRVTPYGNVDELRVPKDTHK